MALITLPDLPGGLYLAVLALPLGSYFLWCFLSFVSSPLRKYPGPLLASKSYSPIWDTRVFILTSLLVSEFTRLWYLRQASTGDSHLELKRLHDKHGSVVQIAPHIIDVDMPELIHTIFNIKGDWLKTEFYHGSSALVNGQIVLNIFSQTDPAKHAEERKPIAKYYSPSATAALEPHMDKIINKLCHQLEIRFVENSKICDLGKWILYCKLSTYFF